MHPDITHQLRNEWPGRHVLVRAVVGAAAWSAAGALVTTFVLHAMGG